MNGTSQGGTGSGVGVFDGIDLDWEYPDSPGNFTLLLQEFRRQMNELGEQTGKYYSLTAALGWAGVTNFNNGLFQDAKSSTRPSTDTYAHVKNLQQAGYNRYWDGDARASWLFNGSTFWTFDDPETMLGGIGIWPMHGDDDEGSLMTAIDSGLK